MTRSRLLFALLLASPVLRADVLVVDAAGGGDFQSLAAAVGAASDGDTLLVRDGSYVEPSPIVIDGKGLTITGEWHEFPFDVQVAIEPGLVVRNLSAGKNVVLQNLGLQGRNSSPTSAALPALEVKDNSAHVRVQSCFVVGGTGTNGTFPDGAAGITISTTLSSAVVGSTVIGGSGNFSANFTIPTGDGGPGLVFGGGPVLVSHSEVLGGYGGSNIPGGWADGGTGGAGIQQVTGSLLLVGGGGIGGSGGTSHYGGDGGDGLDLGKLGAAVLMGGWYASGGSGGSSDKGPNGSMGLWLSDPANISTDFGGTLHGFDLTSPLREGGVGELDLGGDPTDSTLLFASLQLHQIPKPGYQGVLMLMPTMLIGPFPFAAPGNQTVPLLGPELPVGIESLLVHVQPAYVGSDGVVLGPGRVLTLLDAAF